MATAPSRSRAQNLLPPAYLERQDYFASAVAGLLFSLLASYRLGLWPSRHELLDPALNQGFLFGVLESVASAIGPGPTVVLAGLFLALVTLQVSLVLKTRRRA